MRKRKGKSQGKGVISWFSTVLNRAQFCWDVIMPSQTCPPKEGGDWSIDLSSFSLGVSPTLLGCTCTQAKKAASEKALGEKVHRILIYKCCTVLLGHSSVQLRAIENLHDVQVEAESPELIAAL